MNKEQRKELDKAIALIEDAKQIVETIACDEQDKYGNLTEGLQQSERGQKLEENANTLEDVVSSLDDAIDNINTATE